MLTLILTTLAVATFIYYYIIKPRKYWPNRGVDHGKPRWFFGHTLGIVTHTQSWVDMLQMVYQQSPGARYTGMYCFHIPILVVKDPQLIKQMGVKDFDHFTDHMSFLPEDDDVYANLLIGLKGGKWREKRNLLTPAFTGSKTRASFGQIVENVGSLISYFLKKDDEVIVAEMRDVFSRLATDVVAATICGVKVNSLEEPNNELYLMGQKAMDLTNLWKVIKIALYNIAPPIKKVLKVRLFTDDVRDFFRNLVDETVKIREEKGIVKEDAVHLMLETRKQNKENNVNSAVKDRRTEGLSNGEITALVIGFFIAGSDSVSALMSFATYELAVNQDIQDKLREEVLSTWKACGGQLTYEALMKMRYMDMVISESLRKWPNLMLVGRVCTKPYVIEPVLPGEKPLHLKVGDALWLPIISIQRDPDHYPDPEKFDPERYNEENKSSIKPNTFIPLGVGPRSCIAGRLGLMEAKIAIFYVLLHFELVPVEKTQIPLKICKKSFFLNAERGCWIGLKKIKR